MKKDIHIVIVTYNGMKWLDKCLASTAPYPVVVVDNNSKDSTVAFIKSNYPQVHLIVQEKNLGFGRANNIGIKYAMDQGCSGVFLLNQDAYLYPDTIENLYDYYNAHPEYGLLSPIHLDGTGKKLDRNFSNYMSYDENSDFYSDAILKQLTGCYDVPFVNAAAWFLPRKSIEDIGGFDPIFFHYGEDDNYCQRLRYHDRKLGVLSNCWVRHDRKCKKNYTLPIDHKDYIRKSESDFKKELANISRHFNKGEEFYLLQRQFFRSVFFMLKGKFSIAKKHYLLFNLQRKWLKDVMLSKLNNRRLGSHYI